MKRVKKILLIDDDEIFNFLHRRLLESMNIVEKIDEVTDGFAGLKYVEQYCAASEIQDECPNLVFLDINMPEFNGFEFLDVLEKMQNIDLNNLHVVMLTSSTGIKDIQEAAKHPTTIKGYISKPLIKESVLKVLESIS